MNLENSALEKKNSEETSEEAFKKQGSKRIMQTKVKPGIVKVEAWGDRSRFRTEAMNLFWLEQKLGEHERP